MKPNDEDEQSPPLKKPKRSSAGPDHKMDIIEMQATVLPSCCSSSNTVIEGSWAGVCFNPSDHMASVYTTHSLQKDLAQIDLASQKRQWHVKTSFHPTSIDTFGMDGPLSGTVALGETHRFSIWDPRCDVKKPVTSHAMNNNSGTSGAFHTELSCCAIDGTSIAVAGGSNKIVQVYDARKWSVRHRWKCPLKYELLYLQYSPNHANVLYVAGTDNELIGGDLTLATNDLEKNKKQPSRLQQHHRLGFRGDSSWVGVSVLKSWSNPRDDLVSGACETGTLYNLAPAQDMVLG